MFKHFFEYTSINRRNCVISHVDQLSGSYETYMNLTPNTLQILLYSMSLVKLVLDSYPNYISLIKVSHPDHAFLQSHRLKPH